MVLEQRRTPPLHVQHEGLQEQIVLDVRVPYVPESPMSLLIVLRIPKDVFDERVEEMTIGWVGTKTNRLSHVLQIMILAQLELHSGIPVLCRSLEGRNIVGDDNTQRIASRLQQTKELQESLSVFRRGQDTHGDVVLQKVDPIDEGNLFPVVFDGHIFAVNVQDAGVPVAILLRKLRVLGKYFELSGDARIRLGRRKTSLIAERPERRTVQMPNPKGFRLVPMIDPKAFPA